MKLFYHYQETDIRAGDIVIYFHGLSQKIGKGLISIYRSDGEHSECLRFARQCGDDKKIINETFVDQLSFLSFINDAFSVYSLFGDKIKLSQDGSVWKAQLELI